MEDKFIPIHDSWKTTACELIEKALVELRVKHNGVRLRSSHAADFAEPDAKGSSPETDSDEGDERRLSSTVLGTS